MAKKRQVLIDVVIDDKGTTKKVAVDADRLGTALDDVSNRAKTTDKNTKGLAQTASAGGKNFANMARGITGGLVPAYATLAANIFAISAAFNFLKRAADTADLRDSQVQFAQGTGVALSSMTDRLRDASNGMLGFKEAASAAAIGVAKGFSSEQLEDMAVSATKVSKALGRDFEDSFDRLVRGVSKAEPELLDELGITLKLDTATKTYAKSIGKSVESLTAAERSQAVLVETQRQLNDQYGEFEGKANPFVQLSKTFEDIVNTVTEFFLPIFEKIAQVVADNAIVALAFFGTIAAGIMKSMPFMDGLSESFSNFIETQENGLTAAKEDLDEYKEGLKATKQAIIDAKAATDSDYSTAKSKAGAEVGGLKAKKGSGLERLQQGKDISERQRKAMLKAAKNAQGEYAKLDKKRRKILIKELEKMGKAEKKQSNKLVRGYRQASLNVKLLGTVLKKTIVWQKQLGTVGAWAMQKIAKGAKIAGKAMNAMMKATVILGVIQMVYDAIMAIIDAPYTIMMNLIDAVGMGLKAFEFLFNKIGAGWNWVANKFRDDKQEFEDKDWAEGLTESLKDAVGKSSIGQLAKGWEDARTSANDYKDMLDELGETAKDVADELRIINEGIAKEKKEGNMDKASMMTAKAITTSGIAGMITNAINRAGDAPGADATQAVKDKYAKMVQDAFDAVKVKLKEQGGILSPKIAEIFAMKPADAKVAATNLTNQASAFVKNTEAVLEGLRTMGENLSGGDLIGAKHMVASLEESKDGVLLQAKQLGLTTGIVDKLTASWGSFNNVVEEGQEAVTGEEGAEGFLRIVNDISTRQNQLVADQEALNQAKTAASHLTGAIGEQEGLRLTTEEAILAVEQHRLELWTKRVELKLLEASLSDSDEPSAAIENLKNEIAALEKKGVTLDNISTSATEKMKDIDQIGTAIGTTLQTSMASAFQSIVNGTKSASDAFKDMAKSILASIVQIITKLMVMKMLESTIGTTGFGEWLGLGKKKDGGILSNGLDEYRYGGIAKAKNYSQGGIAKGRDRGYLAALHGTEAVVPLPNNREIPVDLKGGGSNQNNVSVNVVIDNEGGASQNTEADSVMGENLGNVIAKAVQEELQFQKRSGGLLSPYGVA